VRGSRRTCVRSDAVGARKRTQSADMVLSARFHFCGMATGATCAAPRHAMAQPLGPPGIRLFSGGAAPLRMLKAEKSGFPRLDNSIDCTRFWGHG
jgi:hypothetical protein